MKNTKNDLSNYISKLKLMYQSTSNEKNKEKIKELIDECSRALDKDDGLALNSKTRLAMDKMNGRYEKYCEIKKRIKTDDYNNFVR